MTPIRLSIMIISTACTMLLSSMQKQHPANTQLQSI